MLAQLASTVNGSLDLAHAGIVALQTLEAVLEILTAALLLAAPAGLVMERSRPRGERRTSGPTLLGNDWRATPMKTEAGRPSATLGPGEPVLRLPPGARCRRGRRRPPGRASAVGCAGSAPRTRGT